jgi:hypothetical protein
LMTLSRRKDNAMETQANSLLPQDQPVALIDITDEDRHRDVRVVATRDHELVRRWAQRHSAEPATGEATPSGPPTVDVHDEGTGLRFNFPGVQRFRPIAWDEWLSSFERDSLVFVYERAASGESLSYRYRLLPIARLEAIAHVRG